MSNCISKFCYWLGQKLILCFGPQPDHGTAICIYNLPATPTAVPVVLEVEIPGWCLAVIVFKEPNEEL